MSQALPPVPSESAALAFRVNGSAVRGFIVRFAGIVLALSLLPFLPGWEACVNFYMLKLASVVNALLQLLGHPTQMADNRVFTAAYSVTLAPHCAALDIVLFYSATVLAFPTSAGRRLGGLGAGFACSALLNVVRITSIWLVGARWPARVQGVNEGLWPVLLIMGTLALCAGWLCWANEHRDS